MLIFDVTLILFEKGKNNDRTKSYNYNAWNGECFFLPVFIGVLYEFAFVKFKSGEIR